MTFPKIIGRLASKRKPVWAELCAYSLTDDIAAFSEPDGQDLYEQCEQFQAVTASAMKLGKPPIVVNPNAVSWTLGVPLAVIELEPETPAWMLSLDCKWQPCTVQNRIGRLLTVCRGDGVIEGGMSARRSSMRTARPSASFRWAPWTAPTFTRS